MTWFYARIGAVLALAGLLGSGTVQAQDVDIRAIQERLEKLEQQNQELQRSLDELRRLPDPAPKPDPNSKDMPGEGEVKKIVKDYLKEEADKKKEEEKKKKEEEEKKKKEEEEAGFEVGKDLKLGGTWRDGVWLETADRAFRLHVGGRADFDSVWYSVPNALNTSIGMINSLADPTKALQDGAHFRRARLRFDGNIYEVIEFINEVDFANAIDLRRRTLGVTKPDQNTIDDFEPGPGVRINDMLVGINQLPLFGTIRAGHMREFLSFTSTTSGRFLTFMERPLVFDAIDNDQLYDNGVCMMRNFCDNRLWFWTGMFRVNSNINAFDVGGGDYAWDWRLTGLPIWRDDGRMWVHLGIAGSLRALHYDQVRFRGRPLVNAGPLFQTPNIINTGTIFGQNGEQILNFEYASAFGPLTLTSEFMLARVPNAFSGGLPGPNGVLGEGVQSRGNYLAKGWYVEALYFLTGEHRTYRPEQPGYDRIRPRENFFWVKDECCRSIFGRGAWEVGVRYDWVDLTDAGINGGQSQAVTLGLNWHLNPNMKVQWNYVWMDRRFNPSDAPELQDGSFSAFGMRYHWDF